MRNRLSGTTFAVQPSELGEAFLALERGKAKDDPPKVGKMGISNSFSDSLEKSLAKRRKSMYAKHRTFWLWFGSRCGENFLLPNHNKMSLF